jgi:outer membrane protein OmpA-like peptidoglycan-associated protein
MIARIVSICLGAGTLLSAQVPNPTQVQNPRVVERVEPAPIFRIEVVARSTQAVNYLHRGGSTKIDFQGTPLMARAVGTAKVESERGVIHVSAQFRDFASPSSFGPEYLTYVLWAISPDGRPVNLGELTLDHYGAGSNSKIETASDIQTFGMIVTAEPYYAVTQPSDVVVMENLVRPDTRGVIESVEARYELLPRGVYSRQGKAPGFVPVRIDKKNPFELYEAENAVQLARVAGAEKYAPESFQKANAALQQAEQYERQKPGQKPVITMAREAAVRAEDARVVALRRQEQERLEQERAAAQAREDAEKARAEAARLRAEDESRQRAKAEADRTAALAREDAERERAIAARQKADDESRQRAQAESDRAAAERSRAEALAAAQQAQRDKQDAEAARRAAEIAKNEADAARQAALNQQQQLAADAERSRLAAAESDRLRLKAEDQQTQLRRQLQEQLNVILRTRDTARGLIVNMSDVLFDTAQYTLRPGAREKLAKVAGIIVSHPGLKIAVEGHTDSVGGDEYNMRLSENRANAVRTYLVGQGISSANITARGFGKTMPVADNSTAAGRQMNRRVEMVVSGDIIGTSVEERQQ